MAKSQTIPDDLYDSDEPPDDLFGDDDSPSFGNVKSGSSFADSVLSPEQKHRADYQKMWPGMEPLYGPRTEKTLSTPLLPEMSGPEPDTWWGGFGKGMYDEFARPMSTPRSIAQEVLTGGTATGVAKFGLGKVPIKRPGLNSITPDVEASLGELTNQRLLDLQQQADRSIKSSPGKQYHPEAPGGIVPEQPVTPPKKPKPTRAERSVSRIEDAIPPEMRESFGVVDEGVGPNASGESAASVEALSRQGGMRERGETFIVYDKAGVARQLNGPEAVDYQPRPGETYGIKTPRGFVQLNANGGVVPPTTKTIKPRTGKEYPGFQGVAGEPVGDVTGLRGRLDAATEPQVFTGPMDERGINSELARLRAAKSQPQEVIDVGETGALDDFSDVDPFQQRISNMAEDTERMRVENAKPLPIERQNEIADWNLRGRNSARNEGININDIHTPLTPVQQEINDSFKRIRAHSDEYGRKFQEMEDQLPEGEFYKESPEVKAQYEAEQAQLQDAHQRLVDRLDPMEKPRPATLDAEFTSEPNPDAGMTMGESRAALKGRQLGGSTIRNEVDDAFAAMDARMNRPKPDATGIANEMNEGRRQTATQGNQPPNGPPIPPKKPKAEFGPEDFNKEIKPLADTLEDVDDLPDGPEKQGIIRKTNNAARSLLTTWDFSAPGRQGKAFLLNKSYWTSLDDMVRAWHSEGAAKMIADSIDNHPSGYFKKGVSETGKPLPSFAERSGLDLSTSEEVFKATFGDKLKKYTGINKSGRAHTAFLNKLRSDQFVSFMDQAKKAGRDGETNPLVAKQFAEFINNATGRGSLNIKKWKLERNAAALSDVFFAPKNLSGQIRTWNQVLNPYKYITADPIIRKQSLKSLFAIAGTGLAVGELARLGGAEVNNDPTNTDFRKIKFGDTRVDLFGGYQQFPVAASRLLLGESTSPGKKTIDLTSGKFGMPTRASVAERFFVNRLGPVPAFVWSWMSNREFDGKPFELKKALYERTLPIAINDMMELAQEDPKLAAILSPLLITGMAGTQTYTRE